MLRSFLAVVALSFTAAAAQADSFISQTYTGAKTVERMGFRPYVGTELSDKQAVALAGRAARIVRANKNTAVRLDMIRAMHMATENTPTARARFTHALTQISRGTSAAERFARGYNLVVHHDSQSGLAMVRNAAKSRAMVKDAAAQLGAFEAFAYMGTSTADTQASQAYLTEAAAFLKAAKASPQAKTRPLVKQAIAQADDYIKYYPELAKLTK